MNALMEAANAPKMPKFSKKGSSKKQRSVKAPVNAGGITAEEEAKHKEADEKDAKEYAFNNKKEAEMGKANFFSKLWPYTRPSSFVLLGFLISLV